MNSTLPEPNQNANPFANSKSLILRIAIGLGLYCLLVLYPAFIGLHYLYADVLPSLTQIVIVAICATVFSLFAFRQMTQLSPLDQSAEK